MDSWWWREGLPRLSTDPAGVGDAARAGDQTFRVRRTTAQVSRATSRKMNNRLTYLAATLMYIALPAHTASPTRSSTLPLISTTSTEAAIMEVVVSKPRVSYSAFKAAQPQPQYQEHSVAFACQWRIDEASKRGARKLGDSMGYTLRRMQREDIGAKLIPDLKPQDLVDHCRERIASGVTPATVNADATTLRSTLRDYVESNDLSHDWLSVFSKVKHKLRKEQLVGTSHLRDRLPTEEELGLLREHFAKQNQHKRTVTDMLLVLEAELVTARRISELCRIERQHVNVEDKTYMVYDLKNSKGKGYHGEAALIEGAWELFERRLREIPDEPTAKLFPFNSRTCSQRYTLAKKHLQKSRPDLFIGLRMHDNRAEACVRLLDKGYSVLQVTKGVSLHLDVKTMTSRYARIKARDLHKGPAGAQQRTPV